jgi:hypothetical protein
MMRWVDALADEGHRSEQIAGYYHLGFVAGYLIAAWFHWTCARRHFREG